MTSPEKQPKKRDPLSTAEVEVPAASGKRSMEELWNDVFGLPEFAAANDIKLNLNDCQLREKIIGHVIEREIRRGPSRADTLSMRSVAKSWLEDTNNFLLKSGKPLYRIHLTHTNSVSTSPEVRHNGGKLLDKFVGVMRSPERIETDFPPFSLEIDRCFFREENYASFSNFLANCAPGLVELTMIIPRNGGSLTFLFPGVNLIFPNLRKFVLTFPDQYLRCCREDGEYLNESNSVVLPFLQSILSGSESLDTLKFLDLQCNIPSRVPHGIRYLRLPRSITTLRTISIVRNVELDPLFNSDLPNLQNLYFNISQGPDAINMISRILEKFRHSLRDMHIRYITALPESRVAPNLFRIPLMKNMKRLYFSIPYAVLLEEHPPVQELMPDLNALYLMKQSIGATQKWIRSSQFPNVTLLGLSPPEGIGELHTLNLTNHFTNLRALLLELTRVTKVGHLNPIFQKMTQLKKLELYLLTNRGSQNSWNSVLTGIPGQRLLGLQESTQLLPKDLPSDGNTSIVNLQELENLVLWTHPVVVRGSLISNLVFQLAFLHMPKLKTLEFEGAFRVSAEMARVWGEGGGTLLQRGALERKTNAYLNAFP